MKKIAFLVLMAFLGAGIGAALVDPLQAAVTNADYSGTPPFVASAVTPNVLILMDNSGSMGLRAYCGTPAFSGFNVTCSDTFLATTTYSGMFDPMKCYSYSATNTRFETSTATTKTAINTSCGSTEWDGNFLNYVGLRRFDAVKKAMIGGSCAVARAADGSCPASGAPAKITLKAQTQFSGSACCQNDATPAVPNTTATGTTDTRTIGRVPDAVRTAGSTPATLFFVVRGTPTPLAGFFCVNESATFPGTTCTVGGGTGFTEQSFAIRVAVDSEPAGVAQDLGDKARFGLMEFKGNDGIKVLTPIGARQSIDFTGTTLETFTTNKAAMIDAVEESFPATNTPLGESLYEGIRYIAQVNSAFFPSSYVYPIAFSDAGSNGKNLGVAGTGSLGPGELTALTGSETCPAGYITSACGRDPYFFGSNHTPAWASPSAQITCCKTFLIVFTDGEPTVDATIPAALQDYAHSAHGLHCTGSNGTIHTPNGTCNTNTSTPASTLLGEHKTDYSTALHSLDDVAYWGHTVDLRQATIPVINEAGHDIPGTQTVTVYSFFAFGNISGREILMQTAKQGGFEDANGNNIPDNGQTPAGACVSGGPCEYDKTDNTTGLLVPDGIPDTFFESQNVDDLKDKLLAAITSILQKAASGTSVSVLATSSTGEGAIYQAFFFPSTFVTNGSTTTEVKWTGFTQGLFIDTFGNLREDYSADGCAGSPDGKLVLKHDCIIKVRLDTATNDVKVDRFKDDNGDGLADSTTPTSTVSLKEVQPIWEGGKRLALLDPGASCPADTGGVSCRRILTWLDVTNGGGVSNASNSYGTFDAASSKTEYGEFSAATTTKVAMLCPYLGGSLVADCNSAVAANKTAALNEATGIINFIRGCDELDTGLAYCTQITGLRRRQVSLKNDTGATVTKTWKLGDIIHSTPAVVGPPRERYDVIYGDAAYASFFQRYKDRRQVAYVGANDGMLHAFNAGFFTLGDDTSTTTVVEQARFTTVPQQKGTSTDCSALPCDASVTQYSYRPGPPKLGTELWAFIPQDLLPHLRWLTSPSYDHTFYVDLKPKITDARIFTADADHPGGWGTILIGGFRLGGSCTNCTQGKSVPRAVTSDFNGDGDTTDSGDIRVFLSSYFVMDVTNPEKDPTLLWVFRDKDLGLTTSEPVVLRVKPVNSASDPKTNSTNEKWYVVFGTGPTHLDGGSSQTGKFFAVDLKQGPSYDDINKTSGTSGGTTCTTSSPCITAKTDGSNDRVRVFSTGQSGSFMGNPVTVDFDLDFRVEAIYAGTAICTGGTPSPCNGSGPQWKGTMYRLTTNGGDPDPDTWGLSSAPTKLISTFAYTTPQATTCTSASPCNVGPVLVAPALSTDDNHNLWVFFGTGRFLSNVDKTNQDIQHYFGVKDCVVTGGCSDQTVERNNLYNVSGVTVCTSCAAGANVSTDGGATYTSGFSTGVSSLVDNVLNADGWFTTLPSTRERNLSTATVVGGTVFFTTFVPTSDICKASGDGYLYALYYLTGTAYTQSAIGESAVGSNTIANRSISLGAGLPSQMAIQLGSQGSGTDGTVSSSGCTSGMTGFIQASTGALGQLCGSTAGPAWSRMVAWRDL